MMRGIKNWLERRREYENCIDLIVAQREEIADLKASLKASHAGPTFDSVAKTINIGDMDEQVRRKVADELENAMAYGIVDAILDAVRRAEPTDRRGVAQVAMESRDIMRVRFRLPELHREASIIVGDPWIRRDDL
ncbi:MAG: hypothetical protein AAFX78_02610 [Cyanobacteria bacterium J06638_20]